MGTGGSEQAPGRRFLAEVSALAVVGVLGLVATAYVALGTSRGLRLDHAAADAVSSPARVLSHLEEGVGWVSIWSVGLSLLVCVTLALVRRRLDLALGAVVIIGCANLTTQILKHDLIPRLDPDLGRPRLPSGHTTVGLSIALAAVIVAPPVWRATVAMGVSATSALMGVALVLGRYHHPSDVIAATFVCVGWAAVGLLTAVLVRSRHPEPVPTRAAPVHVGALIGASLVGGLLVAWGVRPEPGLRDLGLGVISLGAIALACAFSVAAVARVADRHLG